MIKKETPEDVKNWNEILDRIEGKFDEIEELGRSKKIKSKRGLMRYLKEKLGHTDKSLITLFYNTLPTIRTEKKPRGTVLIRILFKRPRTLFKLQYLLELAGRPGSMRIIHAVGFIPARYTIKKGKKLGKFASSDATMIYKLAEKNKGVKMPEDIGMIIEKYHKTQFRKKISKDDIIKTISALLLNGYFEYEFIEE